MKFGKIDVGRYPEAAEKWHVNDSSLSRQLPSVIMFKEGKEAMRRPTVDRNSKLQKFFFTEVRFTSCFITFTIYFPLVYFDFDYPSFIRSN